MQNITTVKQPLVDYYKRMEREENQKHFEFTKALFARWHREILERDLTSTYMVDE